MPRAVLATDAQKRDDGNFPELKLVNFYYEPSPVSATGGALLCRHGLIEDVDPGTGPIHGIFASPGTFGGDRFTVSGQYLYRETTQIGQVLGTGPVRWAASGTEIVVTRGLKPYSYNGTNLQPIAIPDLSNVIDVVYIAGLFGFVLENSELFYWSEELDGRDVDSLSFISAELGPDNLVAAKVVLGSLFLIGEKTIETWYPSGDQDLPFTRVDQRLYTIGARNTASVTQLADTVLFVSQENKVFSLAGEPQPISNPGKEQEIGESADCSAFAFTWNGHAFACFRLDTKTPAFDLSTQQWTEFATYGHTNWRPKCAINVGSVPYFGDDTTDSVWTFDTRFSDDGDQLEGYFRAYVPIEQGTLTVSRLIVQMNSGQTQPLTGDDANPIMEVRASNDAGNSFDDWVSSPIGGQGFYRNEVVFTRMGVFDAPGALFEFRVTDQSPRRISNVVFNGPGGGRSRA